MVVDGLIFIVIYYNCETVVTKGEYNMKNTKITRDDITFNPQYLIFPNSNVCSVVAVAQALDISFDESYERLAHEGSAITD